MGTDGIPATVPDLARPGLADLEHLTRAQARLAHAIRHEPPTDALLREWQAVDERLRSLLVITGTPPPSQNLGPRTAASAGRRAVEPGAM